MELSANPNRNYIAVVVEGTRGLALFIALSLSKSCSNSIAGADGFYGEYIIGCKKKDIFSQISMSEQFSA